jgi:hypothetical protein
MIILLSANLDGYLFDLTKNRKQENLDKRLEQIVDRINIDKLKYNSQNTENHNIYTLYEFTLERQLATAYWRLARSANVQGDLKKVKGILNDSKYQRSLESNNYIPMKILYEVEETVFKFFSGNPDFLADRKTWLNKQKEWLHNLTEYIQTDNLSQGHYKNTCDLNIYVCAAEIFGRVGRLDMRFNDGNYQVIKNAIDNLLKAAYCSSRIGNYKRTAHWLINASRSSCLIGEAEKAEQLANLGEQMLKSAIDTKITSNLSNEYIQSGFAEMNLAHAERYLLIDKDYKKSLKYAFNALKGSIYLRFARVISESLYAIARISKHLSSDDFHEIFAQEIQEEINAIKSKHDSSNKTVNEVIKFLSTDFNRTKKMAKVSILEQPKDTEIIHISEQFKKQALKIWDDWYKEIYPDLKGQHRISEMMDKENFLKILFE